ncbi:hypothetical protein K7395_24860 [Streptomyces filamentosus]|uniref:Integral membrane protein n=2 Tax=Streptomyces filamentosus TaxID=67294 RepID=A0ABY4UZR0_STRFL|nr:MULTISPECIES: hypothetical protein [Streptomyces]EFE74547.1 predicted protein [Streptomyces filamentosus NRRL 15998]ESU46472.1 hypothetical protein P376_5546 [Streptomyces sp. HCCB10043]EWS91647.1 hypothetical protein SSIG_02093 [Streptomyces filamentosus NRRL 11379]MYR78676.1 hypothetical protein [Streptomyces sp. SID5466]USC49721.1 hypothetical protein K7395_24860 [Streptomyces filamentosus]
MNQPQDDLARPLPAEQTADGKTGRQIATGPDEHDLDELTEAQLAELFAPEHTEVELLLLTGYGRPAARRPQHLDVHRAVETLPGVDNYDPEGRLIRHRAAMRRHRRTRAILAAAAAALGLLALVALARGQAVVFGFSLVVSVFLTETAARVGRSYREAAERARRAETLSTRRRRTACCAAWVSSGGVVHGQRCDARWWSA